MTDKALMKLVRSKCEKSYGRNSYAITCLSFEELPKQTTDSYKYLYNRIIGFNHIRFRLNKNNELEYMFKSRKEELENDPNLYRENFFPKTKDGSYNGGYFLRKK